MFKYGESQKREKETSLGYISTIYKSALGYQHFLKIWSLLATEFLKLIYRCYNNYIKNLTEQSNSLRLYETGIILSRSGAILEGFVKIAIHFLYFLLKCIEVFIDPATTICNYTGPIIPPFKE